jgi:tetratricopeptide (TPR) repeat protein
LFVIFYRLYISNIYFEDIFLKLFKGKPIAADYYILSLSHFLDILNELFLLSPLLIFLLVLSLDRFKFIGQSRPATFLATITGASLLFIFTIDPKLGMARDWDLFSLSAMGPTLLCIHLSPEARLDRIINLVIPIMIFLLVMPLSYLLTNLNTERSIKYFEYIIDLDSSKSYSSLIALNNYYKSRGAFEASKGLEAKYKTYCPDEVKIKQALDEIAKNNINQAEHIFRTIKPNKYNYRYQNLCSQISIKKGDARTALKASSEAIKLTRYDAQLMANRAQVLKAVHDYSEALALLEKGYELDSMNTSVLEGLSALYLTGRDYIKAKYYANKLISEPINDVSGYAFMCKILLDEGKIGEAKRIFEFYERNGQPDPLYDSRVKSFRKLLSLDNQPPTSEDF